MFDVVDRGEALKDYRIALANVLGWTVATRGRSDRRTSVHFESSNSECASADEPYKVVDQMLDLVRAQASSHLLSMASSSVIARSRERSQSFSSALVSQSVSGSRKRVQQLRNKR